MGPERSTVIRGANPELLGLKWINAALAGPGELSHRLVACLEQTKRFLEDSRTDALLDALLGANSIPRSLVQTGLRLDHVGFIAPPGTLDAVAVALERIGLDTKPREETSRIVARELISLAGGEADIPTRVAHLPLPASALEPRPRDARSVEIFEAATTTAQAMDWIRRGVAAHVGFEVLDPARFSELIDRFPEHGLRIPAFMGARPLYLPKEGVTIAYFDLGEDRTPARIELRCRGEVP
jgi:hypothetical protein